MQLGRQGIPAPVMSWSYCLSPWALGCEEVSSGGDATRWRWLALLPGWISAIKEPSDA